LGTIWILQAGAPSPAGFSSGAAFGFGAAGFFTALFVGFFALALAFFAGISAQLYCNSLQYRISLNHVLVRTV
jgi:hypothetical protein